MSVCPLARARAGVRIGCFDFLSQVSQRILLTLALDLDRWRPFFLFQNVGESDNPRK